MLCRNILPFQGRKVQHLTFDEEQDFQLFRPYIHHLTCLQSLTCKWNILTREANYLRVMAVSSAADSLATLFLSMPQMSSIRYLSIDLWSIETLMKIFTIMTNIEELNLSIFKIDDLKFLHLLKLPKTLVKLHLEVGTYRYIVDDVSFISLNQFLAKFKDQLTSLTIVVVHTNNEFSNFNRLRSLVNNFIRLETFHCHICTNSEPYYQSGIFVKLADSNCSLSTVPQPQPSNIISDRSVVPFILDSNLTLQQLLICTTLRLEKHIPDPFQLALRRPTKNSQDLVLSDTFKLKDDLQLINLKHLKLRTMIEEVTPGIRHFLSKVMAQAPYFYTLSIYSGDTKKMIEQLKLLIPLKKSRRIISFSLNMPLHFHNYHNTYFAELSQILPNLRTMRLFWTTPFVKANPTTLTAVIQDLREYFPRLAHLTFLLSQRTPMLRDTFANYKKNLDQNRLKTDNEFYYSFGHYSNIYDCLKIWL